MVSFWILPVTERWYSLKSLACCRMLLRYSWGGGGTPPGALGAAWGVPQSHARSLAGIHLIECLNPYLWGRGELLEENTPPATHIFVCWKQVGYKPQRLRDRRIVSCCPFFISTHEKCEGGERISHFQKEMNKKKYCRTARGGLLPKTRCCLLSPPCPIDAGGQQLLQGAVRHPLR